MTFTPDASPVAAVREERSRGSFSRRFWDLLAGNFSLLIVGACVVALASYWMFHLGASLYPSADSGIIEVNVNDAARGRMLTGPYSRFGWNHPGPLLFYALAPLYYAAGRNPVALHLGIALLNGLSVLAAVAVVRKMTDESAARWAAVVAVLFLVGLSPQGLSQIWNPNVLAAPLLLFFVLCAAAVVGRSLALALGAALLGSFLVQSHVIMVGLVGGLLAIVAIILVATVRRQEPARGHKRRLVVAAAVTLAAVWIPPLLESFPSPPHNLLRLGGFLLARGGLGARETHDIPSAAVALVRQAAGVPLGVQTFPLEVSHLEPARAIVVLAGVAASLVAAVGGMRRRKHFGTALAMTSLVALSLALLSATSVPGPLLSYLFWWCAALPLPGWIALGVTVSGLDISRAACRRLRAVVATAAVAVMGWFVAETVRTPFSLFLNSKAAPEVVSMLLERLPDVRTEGIEIVMQESSYGDSAAVFATLRRQGIDAVVPQSWAGNFGRQHLSGISGRPPRHVAYLLGEGQKWDPEPPGLPEATPMKTAGGMLVWLSERGRPHAPSGP